MFDFLRISTRSSKQGIEIYPKFRICKSSDLMIRGGDFYAIWLEDRGMWSTDEQDVLDQIDYELDKYAKDNKELFGERPRVLHVRDSETRFIGAWHQFCQRDMRDSYHMLDEKLIFSNMPTSKKDYASKRLPYPLEQGSHDAYDRLMSVLYSPEERMKIEWAIGSIVSGESKRLQKFMVLYGAAGTGKSTVLNIIQQLFEGYYSVFDAKALGSSSNAFALEAFKTNPLVAIQHDGDLSRIEDNTRLNSLVSHEIMTVNEKFRPTYSNQFKAFLFMGTNKARRQTLLLRVADLQSALLEVLRHIAICRFFRQTRNRARAENVVMPEQLLDVMERAVLIFAGEVQVNIRHLVALKAEEHLERDVEAVLHELLTADGAVLIRQVNADFVLALVHVEKALAAMGAAVMRRKRVDLRDAAHTRNEARTDRTAAADKIPVRVGLADQPLGNVVQRREAIADDGF